MPSCLQVADYFRWRAAQEEDAPDVLTNLKLQKLLYYAQGFHLAVIGGRLFPEDVEAWQHGPVVPHVWHRFKACGAAPIEPVEFERDAFTPEELDLLEEVYSVYGQFSAWRLRNMTHEEPPWQDTPFGAVISDGAMAEYFKTLVAP